MRNGITMIPFGLLSGFMDGKEIRIIELAEEGFRFRLSEKAARPESFLICFYDMEEAEYHEIELRDYIFEKYKDEKTQKESYFKVNIKENTEETEVNDEGMIPEFTEFCTEYIVRVDNEEYRREVRKLQGQYSRYIRLKLEEDDEELARALTGYPEKKTTDYYSMENFLKSDCELQTKCETKYEITCETKYEEKSAQKLDQKDGVLNGAEVTLEIDRPELYKEYLSIDVEQFSKQCREWNWLAKNISKFEKLKKSQFLRPDRIYIGNQFCHLLFPDEKTLFAMMEKAHSESLKITVAFSYIREFMLESVEELVAHLGQWCREKDTSIEILVNDWAMADIVAKQNARLTTPTISTKAIASTVFSAVSDNAVDKKTYLIPCLGVLLNKRKKDPRFPYKKGNKTLYQQNNLNADFYREYLEKEFGILRYEWESCGYEQKFPQGQNSLHLPYYQTNTSQYCPLYAICTTGNRGAQHLVKECPHYCNTYTLSYPENMNMLGRFNSLFGVDKELLDCPENLKGYIEAGVDRLVVSWK